MKTKFRILLIDDAENVLEQLDAILDKDIPAGDLPIKVNVETLHVTLEPISIGATEYKITTETITKLGNLCTEKFDFIFSDFGFIGDRVKAEDLRTRLLNVDKRGVEESDIQGNLLRLKDIKNRFDELCRNNAIPNEAQNRINTNFIKHKGEVLVYTNSPEPFKNYFDSGKLPTRINEVKKVFIEADNIEYILMQDEFGITREIEDVIPPQKRGEFYSLLLSKRINSLMRRVVLEHVITLQSKLRISKTDKAFRILSSWAIGFGATVAVFGEVLFHFANKTILLFMKYFNLDFDLNPWLNLVVTLLLCALTLWLFTKLAVSFSVKTEKEINNITQKEE